MSNGVMQTGKFKEKSVKLVDIVRNIKDKLPALIKCK